MTSQKEFVLFMALVSTTTALAIDMLLPGFGAIRETFGLSEDSTQVSLTITLFFLGNAVGMLVWGPMSDAFGRKPVLAASMGLYAASALAATLAPTLPILLISRLVWGVGAAGPRTLTQAIVRDRFEGDLMARINSLVTTAFFIGPVLAPIIGAGLLRVGSWRLLTAFGVVTAALVMMWSTRLPETLNPANRRPLDARRTAEGFGSVLSNRVTVGYALALTFDFGAFFSFLGSAELIFDDVFGRKSWFVPFFSISGVLMAGAALSAARIIPKIGASAVAWRAGTGFVVAATAMVVVATVSNGVPNILLWLVVLLAANAFHTILLPTFNALALVPMGDRAGTAASVVGFLAASVGAALASLIDRSIEGTITPMAVGYLIYGALSLAAQAWARAAPVAVAAHPTGPAEAVG